MLDILSSMAGRIPLPSNFPIVVRRRVCIILVPEARQVSLVRLDKPATLGHHSIFAVWCRFLDTTKRSLTNRFWECLFMYILVWIFEEYFLRLCRDLSKDTPTLNTPLHHLWTCLDWHILCQYPQASVLCLPSFSITGIDCKVTWGSTTKTWWFENCTRIRFVTRTIYAKRGFGVINFTNRLWGVVWYTKCKIIVVHPKSMPRVANFAFDIIYADSHWPLSTVWFYFVPSWSFRSKRSYSQVQVVRTVSAGDTR